MTPEYNAKIDLTLPWLYSSIDFMIPVPRSISSTNIDSVIKPFQYPVRRTKVVLDPLEAINSLHHDVDRLWCAYSYRNGYYAFKVWVSMGISAMLVIFVLKLTSKSPFPNLMSSSESNAVVGSFKYVNNRKRRRIRKKTWNPYLYIFGLLLSQGACVAWTAVARSAYYIRSEYFIWLFHRRALHSYKSFLPFSGRYLVLGHIRLGASVCVNSLYLRCET